jgi:hypothetical protein
MRQTGGTNNEVSRVVAVVSNREDGIDTNAVDLMSSYLLCNQNDHLN